MKVIAISDHTAAFHNPRGIDIAAADRHVAEHGVLEGFTQGDRIDPSEMLTLPCDVLVPAAVERVITKENAGKLRCRILAEAANGPTTPDADEILDQRWDEIFVIPDILCNAGGVIVSYFEWVQDLQNFFWSDIEITDRLYRIMDGAFSAVIKRAKERKISHRTAAMSIGVERVVAAKQVRGLFPRSVRSEADRRGGGRIPQNTIQIRLAAAIPNHEADTVFLADGQGGAVGLGQKPLLFRHDIDAEGNRVEREKRQPVLREHHRDRLILVLENTHSSRLQAVEFGRNLKFIEVLEKEPIPEVPHARLHGFKALLAGLHALSRDFHRVVGEGSCSAKDGPNHHGYREEKPDTHGSDGRA